VWLGLVGVIGDVTCVEGVGCQACKLHGCKNSGSHEFASSTMLCTITTNRLSLLLRHYYTILTIASLVIVLTYAKRGGRISKQQS